MAAIKSRVAYLRGLVDGMHIGDNSPEGKLLVEIVKVLDEMGEVIDSIEERQDNMQYYISALDEDLQDVEEDYYGYDDDFDDCINEDDFVEIQCSECGETIFIDKSIIDNKEKIKCPNCSYGLNYDKEVEMND